MVRSHALFTIPDDWPIYTPKNKLGNWLEAYVKTMELNYWTSSTCQSAAYDDSTSEWIVSIMRDGAPATLRPKHLVLATGMSGVPHMPELTGADKFKEDTFIHQSIWAVKDVKGGNVSSSDQKIRPMIFVPIYGKMVQM
jgi:cation diffusion facilitator CzcD-associated flavoprotein CzcO